MWKHYKFDPHSINLLCHTDEKFNNFDTLLHSEWDRALAQGYFCYKMDHHIKKRILDGDLHYVIELNPNRFEKRRMPDPFEYVNTPFDRSKFNFNKIKDEEILLSLDDEQQIDKHLVIINNSPIRLYQVLLVSNRQLEQPQILTVDCLLFGLRFVASSAHPFIYIGFNSLCGYASVNHLHLHGIYMPNRLYIQTIKCSPFHINSNCYLFDLFDVQGFAFEIKHIDEFDRIARHIHTITNYLVSSDIAHNMAIMKGDSFSSSLEPVIRIFVWFRQSNKVIGAKTFHQWNIGCLELSGYTFLQYMSLSFIFRRVALLQQPHIHSFSTSAILFKAKNTGGGQPKVSKRLLSDADLSSSSNDWPLLKAQYDKLLVELHELYSKQIQLRTSSLAFEELSVILPPNNKAHQLKELTQIIQKSPQMFMIDMTRHAQYIPNVLEAIQKSGLNVNPQQDGTTLYLPTPKVTREHREELAKNAKKLADQIIVKMREAYSKAHRNLKKQEKTLSRDLVVDIDTNLKHRLDGYIAQVENIRTEKQKELLDSTF
ncbi:unnamed protein product [Rotaria sordida]|uniref:GDP-D-glucose phosphorylase 1 n=1 Tax=Rotaria sordida TaxID=392033 RepID=A0A818KBJ8_9BILA|nr:unnamed protein product [Rotaria sordida]